MQRLIIPGTVPSVNTMYKDKWIKRRKFRVYTDDAQSWEDLCILLANQWMASSKWSQTSEKVVLRIWFYWKDNKRRDTHNCLKIMLDALQRAGVYEDDYKALPRIIDFEVDKSNPRVEIEIELLGQS
ncbi:RusA family crossover junction endodeoxyribonuclease [Paenibacillus nicotianae]|uniref:RusA family crossover junction endodeoxyribonuclease n=1 Tax=Paenibacillus nicotianae TaxID=1526551 RepID=A0ABW4UUF1_9BACL